MKISYMSNMGVDTLETENDYINLSNRMHEVDYDSVLFTYHSTTWDNWILATRSINKNHKFKYMFAIRTYAISPEYCSMMCRAFDKIDNNRLKLNIVAGDLHQDENTIIDIVDISEQINTTEKRVEYTSRWLDKFINLKWQSKIPDLVISGYSDKANQNAKKYAKEQLMMLSIYLEKMQNKIECEGIMVSLYINCIDQNLTFEENEEFEKMKESNSSLYKSTICGTQEEIISKIINLKNMGITNCLLSVSFKSQKNKLDEIAKKVIKELN